MNGLIAALLLCLCSACASLTERDRARIDRACDYVVLLLPVPAAALPAAAACILGPDEPKPKDKRGDA